MKSIFIDYLDAKTDLCEIGKKYDTDKSSQRENVTNSRHCHPYTLFYDNLFQKIKDNEIMVAELGILEGSSLRMWQEYFPKAVIHGYEYNNQFINSFKEKYNNDRITLYNINVNNEESIKSVFSDKLYDIIIEDTTHQFQDQIRVIKNVYRNLKPGGLLIIEDIFKKYNENDYLVELKEILHEFEDYYFVSLDHVNRNSTGWDNDKLFVLTRNKSSAQKKCNLETKITIITPSYRTTNLQKIKESINFDYINEWIIVYDGKRITENPSLFTDHPKIKEYLFEGNGISGNPQRNYALTKISNENTFIYYLDDDNVVHPNLYKLDLTKPMMYTFNQENGLKGNNVRVNCIDTAMLLIHYSLCKNIIWVPEKYNADGFYIAECYDKNKENYSYINMDGCYYNKLI